MTKAKINKGLARQAKIDEILARLPSLPDSAVIPVEAVAQHDNVAPLTVRRRYPRVQLSPGRYGVRVGHLRHRVEETAA